MMTVAEQIKNLEVLIAHIETRPRINLVTYKDEFDCGTLYCVAGEIPTIPYFQDIGVFGCCNTGMPNMRDADLDKTLNHLFGRYDDVNPRMRSSYSASSYSALCATNGFAMWDKELDPNKTLTDKELALARLNKALVIRKAELTA